MGVAERYNRTLSGRGMANLYQSGLPLTFWAEAFGAAAYVVRHSPGSSIRFKTPQSLWNKALLDPPSKPDESYLQLRPFGCAAFANIQVEDRRKFDWKAAPCIMLGYNHDDGSKSYRLWDLQKRRMVHSRDVVFNEAYFPLRVKKDSAASQPLLSRTVFSFFFSFLLFFSFFQTPLDYTLSLTRQASPPQATGPRSCWNSGHTQGPEVQGDRVPWGVWSRSRRAVEQQNRGAATPPKHHLNAV